MKLLKKALLGLVSLIVLLVAVVYGVSEARLRKTYDVAGTTAMNVTSDPAQLARGRHLVTAVAKCVECHDADLGGKVMIDEAPMGTIVASNLTRGKGGVAGNYTDAQLERAIRHGIRPNGRALVIMPSDEYQNLSDADVSAIIAYIRSVAPVEREHPSRSVGPVARALVTVGVPFLPAARMDHTATRPAMPPEGPTREYGQYLVSVGGCRGCHGPDLSGAPGHGPDAKTAPNITPAGSIGRWSEADFVRAIRTGARPDGTQIDPAMPWKAMSGHTEDELHAIWLYMQTVPPVTPPAKS